MEAEISKSFVGSFLWKIERLAKPLLRAFGQNSEPPSIYEEDLEPLRRMLARIRASLRDSESRKIEDELHKLWVCELRELECSAEDIIEELEFQALAKQKLTEFQSQLRTMTGSTSSKRKRDEQEVGILLSSPPVESLHRKIAKLRELHHEIAFDREALRLRDEDGERCRPCCSMRPPTSSLMPEVFHGRTDDVREVMKLLISNEGYARNISVIPIDGMGGVGKTTLVQRVFNDSTVISHFNPRIWICVSEGLDVLKVTKAIRESLVMDTPCPSELDMVQRGVMRQLTGKRFLLVLDDLWDDEHWEIHWRRIQEPLQVGAEGSKIIVTTRNSRVSKTVGTVPSHHLNCLSDDDCLRIFQQHAFGSQDPSTHHDLITVDKEIKQKCKGLPLVAKVLGCLLQTAVNEEHWKRMLEGLWSSEVFENEICLGLRLSYDHLPMHLKRCFLYCSLFPKGYKFRKDHLARLWRAQGFSESDGSGNFDELATRSLFQHSPSYDIRDNMYVMHDLFHELAQSIAGSECKRVEDDVLCEVHKKTRHSSLILPESHLKKGIQFELIDGLDLRTLLLIRRYEHTKTLFHIEIPDFQLLQCLRALDLSHTDIEELPASIGNLIHLRYLGLRNTKIKRLPQSICGLFKLQTLDLEQCCYLQELPQGMVLLSDLQYLEPPPNLNNCMISVIEKLNLQSLSVVFTNEEPVRSKIRLLGDMLKSLF